MARARTPVVLLLCALGLGVCGCRKRVVQAAPPVVVVPAQEQNEPVATPTEAPPQPAPATGATNNPAPATPAVKPAPRKPVGTPASPKESPEPAPPKPAPPQISPQLSPEEQAAAKQQADESLAATEKNLQQAYGRELNSTQHDLMDKISGFLGQAREALRNSDWVRARNLAQKAYLLSVELVKSL